MPWQRTHQPCSPQTCFFCFPFVPSCTHRSQPEMLQGITVPVPGSHQGKPHRVNTQFLALVVLLHAELSSQKVWELLLSSSFYSVHKKIKITISWIYKLSSKPPSMHCALVRGSKYIFSFLGGGGGEGTGVVPRYLISPRDKSWGVGRKEPKGRANLWGCCCSHY